MGDCHRGHHAISSLFGVPFGNLGYHARVYLMLSLSGWNMEYCYRFPELQQSMQFWNVWHWAGYDQSR